MLNGTGLDQLDLQILEALQRNGRSTFAELGAIVGLKAASVHDRVKRLETRGYLRGYTARLDSKLLGLELTAFVSCYTSADTDYDDFAEAVSALPEVCEVHSVAGEESFVLKVMTRSTGDLDAFLSRLKKVAGILRTKTLIVLSTPFERGGIILKEDGVPAARRLRSIR
ncbi:MAG TPA: Lrp/AsnC family transcriptional regulator [Candidatus Eremiobacteraceae bacterium]|nr:Lrp/AsnC family transcriptional regulator [Candidatus Eremiobacteraceae bacterium]